VIRVELRAPIDRIVHIASINLAPQDGLVSRAARRSRFPLRKTVSFPAPPHASNDASMEGFPDVIERADGLAGHSQTR